MQLLDAPFYGYSPDGSEFYDAAGTVSALVPDTYHVSLNGRPYMIDLNQPFYRQYRRQLAQLIRTQADTSTEPGEQSMDPNGLWRRSFNDPSLGAGQLYLDYADSLDNRFYTSKGIDALTTRWQFELLNDVQKIYTSTNTNLQVLVAEGYVYVVDGQTASYASSIGGSFTLVANMPAVTISSACTDGYNVWFACGADGIYHTTAGASGNADQWVTSAINAASVLGYANGRLMLASGNVLYNIVAATGSALPAALFTAGASLNVPTFSGFAEGVGAIYAAAFIGNRSIVYGMTVTSDGTALGAPVIQGELPIGETITSIYGYESFLIIGSSQGVRMCATSSSGGVTLGSLIPTPASVLCLAGWGRWVWYGWTTFDNTSSGLGRMDLANQVVNGVLPAYCSDLMVTTQHAVRSVTSYQGQMVFAVDQVGIYAPDPANLVASGYINSGNILYDLTDNKVACILDCLTVPQALLYGSYQAQVAVNGGTPATVGTAMVGSPVPISFFVFGGLTGQMFQVQIRLNRDATTTSQGPVFARWTLRSYPAPKRPITWQIPLLLNEAIVNRSSSSQGFDPLVELEALEFMAAAGEMVVYQEGNYSYPVFVQDVEFLPDYTTEDNHFFNGVALVTLEGLPTS